jgi:PAS domain S-box-containing protein
MAPAAGLCFAMFGAAILLRWRAVSGRGVARFGHGMVAAVSVAGALACARPFLGWRSPIEEWFAQVSVFAGDSLVGEMSPMTGFLLLTAGVAYGLRSSSPRAGKYSRRLARALAFAVALAGAGVIGGYAQGHPWLSDTRFIPVALWTGISLVFLGGGLLASRPSLRRPVPKMGGLPTHPDLDANLRSIIVAGALALAIGALAAVHLRHEHGQDRQDARRLIEAIGSLKLAQIADWRQERLNDARFFSQADFASRDVAMFLEHPRSGEAEARLTRWLRLLKGGKRYSVVAVFDTNAVPRLVLQDQTNSGVVIPRGLMAEALGSNQVVMSDLRRGDDQRQIHLDVILPVPAPAISDPAPGRAGPAPIGVILLRLDPRQFLYPLLRSWPTPSRTAETILFRRDGDDVLFLSELRQRTNSAMNTRFRLDPKSDMPAIKAVLGHTGAFEGRDYRGTPILADIHPVPNSSWFLAAKVDSAEIYADMRHRAWLTMVLTVILALAAGLVVEYAAKRSEANRSARELAGERRQLVLAQRVGHLMRNASDAIILADDEGRIIEANDCAQEFFGHTLDEFTRLRLPDLRTPETRADYYTQIRKVDSERRFVFESVFQRKDGSAFPAEVSARRIEIGGARYKLAFLRDITQRKAHEREIERLTRFYAALSQVNQCIVRVHSRVELLQEVCRIVVEFGGFKVAWIAWRDEESSAVKPVARAGIDDGFLDRIKISCDGGDPLGRGPAGSCIREGKTRVYNDFLDDERSIPWRDSLIANNFRAAAALPIVDNGVVRGALIVCSEERGVFQEKEIALLEEMADDISYALKRFGDDERRLRAETALVESEGHYRSLFENMLNGFAYCRMHFEGDRPVDFTYLEVNPAFESLTGLRDVKGKKVTEVIAGIRESDPGLFERYGRVARTGAPERFESYLEALKMWFAISLYSPQPDHFVAVFDVITERKQADAALRESEAQSRAIFETASIGMAVANPSTGLWQRVNQKLCETTGYSAEEMTRMRFSEITHPDDRDKDLELFQRVVRGEAPNYRFEKRYIRKDGALAWVSINMSVIRSPAGEPLRTIATIEDVTSRKQLEEQLRQAQKMEAIGQLAGGVAHDFNNILAATMMQVGLLQENPGVTGELRESVNELLSHAQRAAALTRQLLLFSRRSVMQTQTIDLNEAVENLLKMLRRLIGEQINLDWSGSSHLPPVAADAGMLEQVIMNLAVNARDAMPKGGRIAITTDAVDLTAEDLAKGPEFRPGRFVRLTVSDTGCGMSEAVLGRIFEPFFTTKEAGKGTGLGLATVYGIAKQHKGWVTVESQVGRGSAFHIYLPAMEGVAGATGPVAPSQPARGQNETILLVEDEPAVRKSIGAILRQLGYKVLPAANGPEAMGIWRSHRDTVDLLFTDMVMPEGTTGLELAEQVRADRPELPVVISSGYSAELVHNDQLAEQHIHYLPKPSPSAEIARLLRRCLEKTPVEPGASGPRESGPTAPITQ